MFVCDGCQQAQFFSVCEWKVVPIYASGVQEEPNGDCEEANGAYGQS